MDEYISKQAFKDKYLCCGYLPEMSETEFDTFPAADVVEVRHGRWETAPYNGVYDMRCSACGFAPGIRFYSSDYCPNCGARMDKEDEHEISQP